VQLITSMDAEKEAAAARDAARRADEEAEAVAAVRAAEEAEAELERAIEEEEAAAAAAAAVKAARLEAEAAAAKAKAETERKEKEEREEEEKKRVEAEQAAKAHANEQEATYAEEAALARALAESKALADQLARKQAAEEEEAAAAAAAAVAAAETTAAAAAAEAEAAAEADAVLRAEQTASVDLGGSAAGDVSVLSSNEMAGREEEKSSDAPPGQMSASVAERDGWDVVVDEDTRQDVPPVELTDAHVPVGAAATQDAINLDTYDAAADVEDDEEEAQKTQQGQIEGATTTAADSPEVSAGEGAGEGEGAGAGADGDEGFEEDNLEPGDDGLPWVLPDASWFQDPAQAGGEGSQGSEGDEGDGNGGGNGKLGSDPSHASMTTLEEPVLGEHDFEPLAPPTDAMAHELNDSAVDVSLCAAEAEAEVEAEAEAEAEADTEAVTNVATSEPEATPAPTAAPAEPWMLDPLDPTLGDTLLSEATSYMQAYAADLTEGKLTPEVVRDILSQTGLPFSTLKDVWELADIDKDGLLDEPEFALALFLCRRVVNGAMLPQVLHPTLIPPSKR